jgi:hypothetical protein
MTVVDLTPGESKVLQAARDYAAALAVLRGVPPFTADDVLRIFTTREMLLSAAACSICAREPSPTAPATDCAIRCDSKPGNG